LTRARGAVALSAGLLVLWADLLASCAAPASGLTIPTSRPGGLPEQIPATLSCPEGPGPFPAVVVMHDCSGLGPASSGAPARWARELVGRGYVVLVPDSFSTRGHADGVCVNPSRSRDDVSPARRVHDAVAALAYLRTRPEVDAGHIGLMGGSHGGTTTLAAIATQGAAGRDGAGFAAAVALYPSCTSGPRGWRPDASGGYAARAPLLILIGDRDDWTPAAPCQALAETAQRAGQPVAIKVYPDAHHSFDSDRPVRYRANRINANAPGGRGATTGGNPEAWADSIRRVIEFFARHLR